MPANERRERFAKRREEHYLAGRLQAFNGLFESAGLALGYAIEFSMKMAVLDLEPAPTSKALRRELLNGHDLRILWRECRAAGLFRNVAVSDDFITYANDYLNSRYPAQERAIRERRRRDGTVGWFQATTVRCYDDMFLQLDDQIATVGDPEIVSVHRRMSRDLETHEARLYFHANQHAIVRLEHFDESRHDLWRYEALPIFIAAQIADPHPAATFKYPAREERVIDGKVQRGVFMDDGVMATNSTRLVSLASAQVGPSTKR